MDIGSVLGSIFTGGVTGLLGVVTQRVFEYKSKQLDIQMQREKLANDVAMKQADAAIMAQEWAQKTKIAQVEEQGKESVADSQAFSAALTSEPQRYADMSKATPAQEWLMISLDFIRGFVRPALTIYLCVLTTLIYWQAKNLLNGQTISIDQAIGLTSKIVDTVLYLCVVSVTFWFGTRTKSRAPKI